MDSTRLSLGWMVTERKPTALGTPPGKLAGTCGFNSTCCAEKSAGGAAKRMDEEEDGRQLMGPRVGELEGPVRQPLDRGVASTLTWALG